MISDPDWTPERARQRLELSEIDFQLATHTLVEAGLLQVTAGEGGFAPVAPEAAVARLLAMEEESSRSRSSELRERRSTLSTLASNLPLLQARASSDTRIEVLTGQERIAKALDGVSVSAGKEILSMHAGSPLPREALEASREPNRAVLDRGVAMRSIHLESMTRMPYAQAHLQALKESGCQVRMTPVLPFRMILVDGVRAYVSRPARGSVMTALEVTGEEVCWLLRQAFDHCWLNAKPLSEPKNTGQEVELSERERTVLRLLAVGATDDAVARALGVSPRTLRRMTTVILEKIGARSRFEAGVRAAMLSLIETQPCEAPEGSGAGVGVRGG
ncbi:helix-turn-helix transcriptional regulator [Streptomyces sp. NPDC005727]|uniref:helix-turn-helix transcriptional regulator n=1 Tax=Streptomyces sp. NPDC005727 TaxID=3157053 RepID=UPI0033E9BD06